MLRSNLLRGQVSQSYKSLPVVLWHFKPGIIDANSQWNFPRYSSHKIVLSSVGSQNVVGHLGHAIINATKSPSGVMKTVFVGLKYTFISEAFINQFTVIIKGSRWDVKTFQIIKHVVSIDAAGSLNIKSVSLCAGFKMRFVSRREKEPWPCDDISNTSICQQRIEWSNCNHMPLTDMAHSAALILYSGRDYACEITVRAVLKMVRGVINFFF